MVKISIGIPAYNEEGNISNLLASLLAQKATAYELAEIIVVSDGSTDRTVAEVQTFSDPRIILVDSGEREGKALTQNLILESFKGDLLVLLDADCEPASSDFLDVLISSLPKDKKVGLVSCTSLPVKSHTIVGNLLDFSIRLKNALFDEINGGDNLYHCHGTCRVLNKEFAQSLRFPRVPSEDAFSYLECIKLGYTFHFSSIPVMTFKTPTNLRDYLKQSSRFLKGHNNFTAYFAKDLLKKEYNIPLVAYAKAAFKFFFKHPIYFVTHLIGYTTLFVVSVINAQFVKVSAVWTIATSSKKL